MNVTNKLRITFCTGVGTVTGANFLLETPNGSKILVDCGMVQGEKVAMQENHEEFPYDLASIDALIITHAHLDHVGRIPKLVKEGYKGPIYSTPETKDLAELVLNDAVNILAEEARREGGAPLYVAADVEKVFPLWQTVEYHKDFKVTDDVSIFLKDAGHILGSSMVEVTVSAGEAAVSSVPADLATQPLRSVSPRIFRNSPSPALKILFTGDLGNSPHPLLRDTEAIGDPDYVVMESVYGDRNHGPKEERLQEFERVIKETIARGGTLVIPAFSLDRTQVLLYELNNLVEQGRIRSVPVFVDSPMGIKATEIYRSSTALFNDTVRAQIGRGDDIFRFPRLQYTLSQEESLYIDHAKGAKIILAGSGMSVGGRVVRHESRFLPDPKNTVLLVGYQAAGSLGRELADGAKKVHVHGETVKVKAKIETLYGYSAHRDSDHLVEFVAGAGDDTGKHRLKQVFVAMGEPGASMHLAQRLNDELNVKALMPERLKVYELD